MTFDDVNCDSSNIRSVHMLISIIADIQNRRKLPQLIILSI